MPSPELLPMSSAPFQPVRTLAVTGGKGGVGKTNVSANLSVALSALGQRTLWIDCAM